MSLRLTSKAPIENVSFAQMVDISALQADMLAYPFIPTHKEREESFKAVVHYLENIVNPWEFIKASSRGAGTIDGRVIEMYKDKLKENANKIYVDNGFENRHEYLKTLAEDFGVPLSTVQAMASILGPNEDFDGLVTHLEDTTL